jgi:hypothetical protein
MRAGGIERSWISAIGSCNITTSHYTCKSDSEIGLIVMGQVTESYFVCRLTS